MSLLAILRPQITSSPVLFAVFMLALGGCSSDNGPRPVEFGAVKGTVVLPFKFAAAGEPVEGASVRITAGDFDTTAITDAGGQFVLGPVPAGSVLLSATLGTCLSDVRSGFNVPANDTARIDLTLASSADFDTIAVGLVGASSMALEPFGNRAVLLVDSTARGGAAPSVIVVNLTTGESERADQPDLTDVYDLAVINSNLIVFNFLSPTGYGLRFFDPVAMAKSGNDVYYHFTQATHAGKLALDTDRTRVFVTHGIREGAQVIGRVWAIDVAQRNLIDADDNAFDLIFSFDNNLVGGALGWPYGIGLDPATSEILVANRQSKSVTAIDWNMWGNFDREAGLTVPTQGVRRINITPMSADSIGFGVEVWGFGGGYGIAAKTLSGAAPILRYSSGGTSADLMHTETSILPASLNHSVKVVPQRQSWFSMFRDPSRLSAGRQFAIEERSTATLRRVYRYESRFVNDPTPTAFAIDPDRGLLYVAYRTRRMIEVFCLP